MEFLNTLYESEYFVYIVGGTIGVLLILFFVILLSGKKKEKETDQKQVEIMNDVTEKSVIADTLPVKDSSLDVTKEFKPEDLAVLQTKMAETTPEVPVVKMAEPEIVMPRVEEPVRELEPVTYNAPTPVNINNQFNINDEVEEVKTVNPESLITPMPEERVTFKVTEESELPKLNDENKEL